jgi:hypothetical protein
LASGAPLTVGYRRRGDGLTCHALQGGIVIELELARVVRVVVFVAEDAIAQHAFLFLF